MKAIFSVFNFNLLIIFKYIFKFGFSYPHSSLVCITSIYCSIFNLLILFNCCKKLLFDNIPILILFFFNNIKKSKKLSYNSTLLINTLSNIS